MSCASLCCSLVFSVWCVCGNTTPPFIQLNRIRCQIYGSFGYEVVPHHHWTLWNVAVHHRNVVQAAAMVLAPMRYRLWSLVPVGRWHHPVRSIREPEPVPLISYRRQRVSTIHNIRLRLLHLVRVCQCLNPLVLVSIRHVHQLHHMVAHMVASMAMFRHYIDDHFLVQVALAELWVKVTHRIILHNWFQGLCSSFCPFSSSFIFKFMNKYNSHKRIFLFYIFNILNLLKNTFLWQFFFSFYFYLFYPTYSTNRVN